MLAYLAIHLIQLLGLYIALTYFAGLWSGAQDQGRHGWIAALLASFAVLLLFIGIDAIAGLIQRPTPDLLRSEQAQALLAVSNPWTIRLVDMLALFLGFSLYGVCWHGLRVRGKKEWVFALLISMLILVIHEAVPHGHAVHSFSTGSSTNQAQLAPA